MKSLTHLTYGIIVTCIVLLLTTSFYSFSQVVPVVLSSRSASRPPAQVPEDAISLTFRGDKSRQSLLEINALEFNNGEEVKEVRRSTITDVILELDSGSTFLLDIYEDASGVVKVSKTYVGKYVTTTRIDPESGEALKCISLGALGDIYTKNVAVALIYDATMVEGKQIELKPSGANSTEKSSVEYVKGVMKDFLVVII